MLFCFPELIYILYDLEEMKGDFEVEQFDEIQLPSIAPIHKEQKSLYNEYFTFQL
ncbi:unnamed protein product [Paramecium pentaurelia]|uniref:Uncharacterized protein n=1 Tax=Paramecium pentaurelia TaxID=43138 RepID=A0A8S1Y6J5_9CILI|nr:unnamed protein product [Paramecium pentaurelia]